MLEFCARVVLVGKPRYREPRWSTLLPPEVHEFRSPEMRRALVEERRAYSEKPAGATAEVHDRVTIDFDGTIEGVPFEGGEGRDIDP